MSNMKSESRNPALEAALRMKATKVADLEAAIREFEGMASALDREIMAEENRTGIKDPVHVGYSNFAKSARQRRDNLQSSAVALKLKLEEVQRDQHDTPEQLNRADDRHRRKQESSGRDRP
jgi:flagellar protein FliJ